MKPISSAFSPLREQQPMSPEEKLILKKLRNKKLLFLLGTYAALAYVPIDVWTRGYPGSYLEALKELISFRTSPSYFLVSLILLVTIFFARYYFRSIHPLFKDLKADKKDVIFFIPGKYQTPLFAEYYLKMPSRKIPLIRVNKDLYDTIQSNTTACIHISPNARFVFSIEAGGIKQKFNYSIAIDDI